MGINLTKNTIINKMKTIAAVAALAAAANAWDAEFMRGAQTGFFLQGEEAFEDYSFPAAHMKPQVQTYIDMAKPMAQMMKNMNQGKDMPFFDFAFDSMESIGRISSLFDEDYDGGEFCKGLLFSKDAGKIVFSIGGKMMNRNKAIDEDVPSAKATALKSKLH